MAPVVGDGTLAELVPRIDFEGRAMNAALRLMCCAALKSGNLLLAEAIRQMHVDHQRRERDLLDAIDNQRDEIDRLRQELDQVRPPLDEDAFAP